MKTTHLSSLIAFSLSAALAACGGAAPEEQHVELSARGQGDAPLPGFPTKLVTGPGSGPALFLGPEEDAPAIGYVAAGVPVVVKSAPVGDRVRVLIDGPIKARGWLRLARLGGYVTHGGRVRGAPASVHPCDFVGVRALDDDGQALHVVVAPQLGLPNVTVGPYEGVLPVTAISGERPDPSTCTPPAGDAATLPAATEVDVYDRPDGRVIAQLPASATPLVVSVARRNGDWSAVRIGTGPYLVGYVHVALTAGGTLAAASATTTASVGGGDVPTVIRQNRLIDDTGHELMDAQGHPRPRALLRVHTGARVVFNGETVGIVASGAYAVEMTRYAGGEVDVFVAANDDVSLRGMVRTTDVEPVAEPATPASGPTPPATPPPATLVPATPPPATLVPATPAPPGAVDSAP